MKAVNPTIIIVGITGDLAEKKLLPALYGLAERGLLADDTKIIGTSRRPLTKQGILRKLNKPDDDPALIWLENHLTTLTTDPGTPDGAQILSDYLGRDDHIRLFYFSIPPSTFANVISSMAGAGLNGERDYILVEKPFGHSGATASELEKLTKAHYTEANVYRVDHYLAKPGIRSLSESGGLVLNPRHIMAIEIRSHEALDIQGRVEFYEESGALRDIIQSHLLQVLALCLSAYKAHTTDAAHHNLKTESLASLEVLGAYRAQYSGYRDEVQNPDSTIETYAALELTSIDHEWRDVKIILRTGKALPAKVSDIIVTFDDKTTRAFDMNANPANILDGYEQVLYDASQSIRTLFLSSDDIHESWRIVDPTLEAWAHDDTIDHYQKGTFPPTTI